jgi:uncharacterized RDD family membrane protein YckC
MRTADDYIDSVVKYMPRATPLRAQIALELRGHIAERVATGQSLDDIVRQLGDPSTLAESYLSAVPLVGASFWRRAAAKALDVLVLTGAGFVIFAPLAWLLWYSSSVGTAIDATGIQHEMILAFMPLFAIVTVSLLFLVYSVVSEWQWGQTIGKYLLGVRAVRESGARVSIGQAFVRHLPVILEVFWIDCLFALFTEKHQRAFEMLSKTRVVLVSPQEVR